MQQKQIVALSLILLLALLFFPIKNQALQAQTPTQNGDEDVKVANKKLAPVKQVDAAPDDMVYIQGGTFEMGCTNEQGSDCDEDEQPAHTVTLDSFYMDKYEVTNAQFCEFLKAKGNETEEGKICLYISDADCLIEKRGSRFVPKKGYKQHPVVEVTWYGAVAYAKWQGKRLPTEAEWEFAARSGGQQHKYAGTSDASNLHLYGNFCDVSCSGRWAVKSQNDAYKKTAPVGRFKPNELGLYDMAGNVSEFCADLYDRDYYASSPENNPQGSSSGKTYRVVRGGSWSNEPNFCRTANRYKCPSAFHNYVYGFRCVKTP